MINFENTQVVGWEPAIRGMRNPMNSWEKSDTQFYDDETLWGITDHKSPYPMEGNSPCIDLTIGPADHDLMTRLAAGGPVHAKYRRMINVYVDITAPLYWWKEFDTYKVGTVANSCSTMHKIQAKEFCIDDFSFEHLSHFDILNGDEWPDEDFPVYNGEMWDSRIILGIVIKALNFYRERYNMMTRRLKDETLTEKERKHFTAKQKRYWWQMIQLLPSSYNQKRTVMMNYEVLHNIYVSRKDHKLDEWRDYFIAWIKALPYSEIITGYDADEMIKKEEINAK